MKVTVENRSSVKKVLRITVPEAEVSRALDEAYQELKKSAKVKGFRPGKTPRGVLERLYKKEVQADVRAKVIQEAYLEALKETQLRVIGSPVVDPPELIAKSDYFFDAAIEVQPEIADIDYTGLSLKKNLYKASDEEVAIHLQMMQKNLAKREPLADKRPAQDGDFVQLDYEGFKDGEPFEETKKTENFVIKLGDAHIAEAFDKSVVGMSPGEEKEFRVSFAEDYFNKKLAGHQVDFKVKLNEIRQEILPEIDDELAKQVGPFTTLEEVRNQIRENLTQGYDKRAEQELNEQIFSQILEKTEFEVPDIMVEFELKNIIADAERSFSYHNKTFEEAGISRESLAQKYRQTAEDQVRRQLILEKIIQQEKMELTEKDLEAGFAAVAATYNQPLEMIKGLYQNDDARLAIFKHALLEKQAIELIMQSNEIASVEPEKAVTEPSQ
ncbi:MAG: trigger factor [Desulfosarcina sp.]